MNEPRLLPTDQHSPGPWESHVSHDVTGYPVFYLHGLSGDQKRDMPTLEANARLIAAAPELLEALKRVVALSDRKHDAWDAAWAAIDKAEGRS